MGVPGEAGGRSFRMEVGGVQFLHRDKLKSEIFNENKFINKNVFLCQLKLRTQLFLKDGMRIKDKKNCILLGFTEKSDF